MLFSGTLIPVGLFWGFIPRSVFVPAAVPWFSPRSAIKTSAMELSSPIYSYSTMKSGPSVARDEPDRKTILAALKDEDCRTIIEALTEPRTASEISETCDIPLSTTYRKVNKLTEAGLLEERIDIKAGGKHTNRYRVSFDRLDITLGEDGTLIVDLENGDQDVEERLRSAWGEIRQEI